MADVEVQSNSGRIKPVGKLQVLLEGLDEKSGLGLDQKKDLEIFGQFDAGHYAVIKNVGGRRPGLAFGERPARLGLNRGGLEVPWQGRARLVCSRRMAR